MKHSIQSKLTIKKGNNDLLETLISIAARGKESGESVLIACKSGE